MFSKTLRDVTFFFPNELEFNRVYEEIFKKHVYYVEFDTSTPTIIDCGGHIGVSVLYFKSLYPQAKIIVFEPEPTLLEYLHKNVEENQLEDVTIIPKAVWSGEGEMQLHIDSQEENHWLSTSSFIEGSWNLRQETTPMNVQTTRLSRFLTEKIDLIKMDIEGAETVVLQEIREQLFQVDHMIIEFHATHLHRPDAVIKILENAGFKIEVTYGDEIIPIKRMTRRGPTLYMIEAKR